MIEGVFLAELKNRFLCSVEINGKEQICYVPSSCRISNFVSLEGKKVLLKPVVSKKAKTDYSLFAYQHNNHFILLNLSEANRAIEQGVKDKRFNYLGERSIISREKQIGEYKNRKDTWECICPIISDKNDLSQIEIDLDPYKVNSGVAYGRRVNKGKRDFYITKEEKTRVVISETSLPVTTIVRNINNVVDTTKVKKLSYESVLKWLIAHGYIYEEKTTEQIIRHPTVKGIENRIIVDGRPSQTKGIYYITYYPPSIQRLIVEHANEMS